MKRGRDTEVPEATQASPTGSESSPSKRVLQERPEEANDDNMEEVFVDQADLTDEQKVWDPRESLPEGHEMVKNNLCYTTYFEFGMRESCYSVQATNDTWVEEDRNKYPYTMHGVAGTQAVDERQNAIILFKVSDIGYTQKDELDSDDSVPDDFKADDLVIPAGAEQLNPDLQTLEIPHPWGMVNKVRSHPTIPRLMASFSSDGRVCLWDCQMFLDKFSNQNSNCDWSPTKPKFSFKGHEDEGYALAWDPTTARLATGDNTGIIHVWEPGENLRYSVSPKIYAHHGSVEDISWMATGGDVFASCSSDASIKLWDLRVSNTEAQHTQSNAHDGDVNIVQFNPHQTSSHLLASGGDDAKLKIWDIRAFGREDREQLASEQVFHKDAISSIVWCPHERSVLATSGYDDMICVWDLSVEKADEPDIISQAAAQGADVFPDMLQFYHCGQSAISDIAWHPHVPGLMISTAQDGLNIFKPYNL